MSDAALYDLAGIEAYLSQTDEELKLYIDPEHMSYLPVYLGRADARFARGDSPEAVLAELHLASKVYASNGAVFLAKWPVNQVRRRRLEPLECGLLAGDRPTLKRLGDIFGLDPMVLYAGIAPDEILAEVRQITSYFESDQCADPIELAGTLAIFYWLVLAAVASEDGESFDLARRRAMRCHDDFGHLAGGASGGAARIRVIHNAIANLKPANPDLIALAVVRHAGLWALEHKRARSQDADIQKTGKGSLDKTALALLAMAAAFDIYLYEALVKAGAPEWLLTFAKALGHEA